MAGARALAIALVISGCGSNSPTTTTSTPSPSPSSVSTVGLPSEQAASPSSTEPVATASPSIGLACGDSRGSYPEPQYAFAHISIPLGSDACQNIGPFTHPQIKYLTNDGSRIAFNSVDYENDGDLWYGDLMTKSIGIVYQAKESTSLRVAIVDPQLAGGQLVWLEATHAGSDVEKPVKEWSVKAMDLATGAVKIVTEGLTPRYGGHSEVTEIRFDGSRIAMLESLARDWQIEIRDLSGKVQAMIQTSQDPFDVALVADGLLYTAGAYDVTMGTVSHTHLWHWTPSGGSRQIGAAAYQINAAADQAAWVVDPIADAETGGNFQAPRLYTGAAPYTGAQPISPADSDTGTKGIDGMACGSGGVAWWEQEAWGQAWHDVLTIWQPGWSSPVQVDTEGSESYEVSVRGDWLVWSEEFGRDDPLQERIRGVPLSVLTSEHSG